jgi:hypothetical protein
MLRGLNDLVIRTSKSAVRFVAVTALAVTCLTVMTRIGQAFPAASGGSLPFDLQNELTVAQVIEQVPRYTELANWMYAVFTMIDYVFPFAAGLFLAAAGAFALRHGFPGAYATAVGRSLFPLFFLGTACDWCENVAAMGAIHADAGSLASWALLLVTAKRFKLAFVMGTNVLVLLLLVGAGLRRVFARRA